jgi:CheY-like chemotaxis protein
MLTSPVTNHSAAARPRRAPGETRKVMIVNGSAATLALLESVLEAGHYDVVFVESSDRAYSNIKQSKPDLIIVCIRVEDLDGFQVLSMLKLDEETRDIPVLTCAADLESEGLIEEAPAEPGEPELFPARRAMPMN